MVERRWAMTTAVRPWSAPSTARWRRASVSLSTFAVASSRIRMSGSRYRARANAMS
jgi:hypothetical protein